MPEPKLRDRLMRMAASFQIDADLLAISRSLIDESRELLASLIDGEATRVLLKNSRAMIDESRRLLAALECSVPARRNDDPHHHATATPAAAPIEPSADGVRADADRNPATLSVNIFEKGSCFGWTVYSPTNDLLGRGTARNVCFGSKADIAFGPLYPQKRTSKLTGVTFGIVAPATSQE